MMLPVLDIAPYTGWVYPNETMVEWSVLIVVYPYITGLVAGAFTVSSLYQVFGMQRFKAVAHFALLTSLSFMFFVPMPLLLHLAHPERALNVVLTPHLTSAMAVFGYIASFYLLLLMLEAWFAFRPHIVHQAQQKEGLLGTFYNLLTLGSYDLSEHAMTYDRKWIFALAVIGIPAAHGLHGYVGFVFGSLKAREWWASDLMPLVFLFSAVISGVALVIALYVAACRLRRERVDLVCLKGLVYTLWGFMMVVIVLEGLEFANIVYKGREGIEMIMAYVKGPLLIPYFVVQLAIGAVTPLVVLTFLIMRRSTGRTLVAGATVSACLVLMSVLMMRWNVVIGGQEISKTGRGLLTYHMLFWGREGALAAASLVVAPLAVLYGLTRLFPPWEHEAAPHAAAGAAVPGWPAQPQPASAISRMET